VTRDAQRAQPALLLRRLRSAHGITNGTSSRSSRKSPGGVRKAAAAITSNPHLARAFMGGAAEVSVFWVKDVVPLKARFDYFKPRAVIDLKGFANQRERLADVAIGLGSRVTFR
jgi:hypothetical protein